MLSLDFCKEDVKGISSPPKSEEKPDMKKSQSNYLSCAITSRNVPSRGSHKFIQDKKGRIKYLHKFDVVKFAKGCISRQLTLKKNVNCNPNEIFRQFKASTSSIRLKMESDIKNYRQENNNVLKKQMTTIKSFDRLPRLSCCK